MCQHFARYQVIFIRFFSVYKFLETEKLGNQLEVEGVVTCRQVNVGRTRTETGS